MNVKFTLKKTRCAILDPRVTGGKLVKVGEVEEYVEYSKEELHINVRLYKDLPKELEEAITKHPKCLLIHLDLSAPQNVMFLPSREPFDPTSK